MIFGKIEYLNLLPFHLFLKRTLRHGIEKKAWQKRGSIPSRINRAFETGRIDAAVISSIKSRGRECTDFGIVADGEVMSVLVLPGKNRRDTDSDTSNALADLLGIDGEVMIGDKALRYRLANPDKGIDLAEAWKEETGLPFVFARLCAFGSGFLLGNVPSGISLIEVVEKPRLFTRLDVILLAAPLAESINTLAFLSAFLF